MSEHLPPGLVWRIGRRGSSLPTLQPCLSRQDLALSRCQRSWYGPVLVVPASPANRGTSLFATRVVDLFLSRRVALAGAQSVARGGWSCVLSTGGQRLERLRISDSAPLSTFPTAARTSPLASARRAPSTTGR